MTKNWHSPTIPAVPNPTPTTSLVSRHASLRAPIYNPYDKFTQPQFDAWIGDITGALKRALGREEELERSPQEGERVADALMRAHHAVEADSSYLEPLSRHDNGNEDSGNDEDPSIMKDSFAHVKSRRAKGKARDPRDGPGLGGKDQPIELLSDSESDQSASVDLEEEWQEDSEEEESEEDYDEDEYEDSDEGTDQYAPGGSGSHAIELISDDDEAEDADSGGPHLDEQDDDDVDQGEDEEGGVQHEIIELDEDDDVQSSDYDQRDRSHSHQRDLLEPAQTLLGLASGPDERDLEDYNEDDGILELPDPWEGPRTYAEDFYSGSVGTNGPDELGKCYGY
ncbi:hypothetical protein OF83DRAFT_1123008 [Amylostereum chailletii]|nr:hypothetical protein OF83DRAFT_1123008 [Amylostereum chailletii]